MYAGWQCIKDGAGRRIVRLGILSKSHHEQTAAFERRCAMPAGGDGREYICNDLIQLNTAIFLWCTIWTMRIWHLSFPNVIKESNVADRKDGMDQQVWTEA